MTYEEMFIIARWAYSIGKDYMSDAEYDRLENYIKSVGTLPEYINRGWSEDPCPYELLVKYGYNDFIDSVTFSYATESIESLNSNDIVEDKLRFLNETSRLSYKLDGFNIRLNYYNGKFLYARTRNRNDGNGKVLMSVSSLFPSNINIKGKVLIIGELYLSNRTFDSYKKLRGIVSQRNGVSTAIANGDKEFLDYRCFDIYVNDDIVSIKDKYALLQELGFNVPKFITVNNYQTLLKGIDIMGKQKKSYPAPTDGLVLENSSMKYALRIGEWSEQSSYSYITGYTVNRGAYNNNILLKIKPIFYNQKVISEIDVDNLQTIIDNDLRVGYPVAFTERSAVNSIFDMTRTIELRKSWKNNYEGFIEYVDNVLAKK